MSDNKNGSDDPNKNTESTGPGKRKERKFVSGQKEGSAVKGMQNNFQQLELDFDNLPSEDEAHEAWMGHDLNEIAVSIAHTKGYTGQVFEDIVQDLMIEGVTALHAWKKGDRKMPLNNYCKLRMWKRLPRERLPLRMRAPPNPQRLALAN